MCHSVGMSTAQRIPVDRPTLPLLADCCTPVVREVIRPDEAAILAAGFKALSDPARLRLISLVAAHADQEACVCDLTEPVGLSQPTVSHHLKLLVESGILSREQRGKWAYYKLQPATLNALAGLIASPSR
jgi:ArsR family transcriptional regulator